ncbi:hypothetical protein LC724_28110 [Blautia sp. RD014234]|nr:hypothetical protein [Blautia parvula]
MEKIVSTGEILERRKNASWGREHRDGGSIAFGGLCVLLAGAATIYLAFDILTYLAAFAAFIALLILLFLVYVHTKCFIKD